MSLRRTALWWLAALIAAIGTVSTLVSYCVARVEADSFLDNQLRQIAYYVGDAVPGNEEPARPAHDPEDDFLIQIWSSTGTVLRLSDPARALPRPSEGGFSDLNMHAIAWRSFAYMTPARTVRISQQMDVRDEIGADAALRTAIPIVILMPLAWLVLSFLLSRLIGRLDALAALVATRDAASLEPIALAKVPLEVIPLIEAINSLIGRLHRAIERQQRFVSDAAHALRTPLTALTLQIGNLKRLPVDEAVAPRLDDLELGAQRATTLVTQLLRLARADSASSTTPARLCDLSGLVTESLAAFMPVAISRSIDLGITQADPASILYPEADLRTLVDAFIDNAVRYTPQGGQIDIAVRRTAKAIELTITDSGPGIAPELLPRVFERFYRAAPPETEGSGLGLAIAEAIALRNDTQLHLENRQEGPGLVARIRFRVAS